MFSGKKRLKSQGLKVIESNHEAQKDWDNIKCCAVTNIYGAKIDFLTI